MPNSIELLVPGYEMIDVAPPETPEILPPGYEFEQIDDYSQYLLHSRTEILSVLRSLISKGALVTVYFDQGKSFFLTLILSLTNEGSEFVVDVGSDEEMNQKAVRATKFIFTAIVDKVRVQFSVDKLTAAEFDGRPTFTAAIPDKLLRLQRREFFRLATPVANPIRLCTTIRRAEHAPYSLEAPLLDISGGGVGLMITPSQAGIVQQGDTLENCKISLPEEGLLIATLGVRNRFDVASRNGSRFVRLGCEYIDLPAARLAAVQRYITRIERERKARLSGLS